MDSTNPVKGLLISLSAQWEAFRTAASGFVGLIWLFKENQFLSTFLSRWQYQTENDKRELGFVSENNLTEKSNKGMGLQISCKLEGIFIGHVLSTWMNEWIKSLIMIIYRRCWNHEP